MKSQYFFFICAGITYENDVKSNDNVVCSSLSLSLQMNTYANSYHLQNKEGVSTDIRLNPFKFPETMCQRGHQWPPRPHKSCEILTFSKQFWLHDDDYVPLCNSAPHFCLRSMNTAYAHHWIEPSPKSCTVYTTLYTSSQIPPPHLTINSTLLATENAKHNLHPTIKSFRFESYQFLFKSLEGLWSNSLLKGKQSSIKFHYPNSLFLAQKPKFLEILSFGIHPEFVDVACTRDIQSCHIIPH